MLLQLLRLRFCSTSAGHPGHRLHLLGGPMPRFLIFCLLCLVPSSAKGIALWDGATFQFNSEPISDCELEDYTVILCLDDHSLYGWVYQETFHLCDPVWMDLYDTYLWLSWVESWGYPEACPTYDMLPEPWIATDNELEVWGVDVDYFLDDDDPRNYPVDTRIPDNTKNLKITGIPGLPSRNSGQRLTL